VTTHDQNCQTRRGHDLSRQIEEEGYAMRRPTPFAAAVVVLAVLALGTPARPKHSRSTSVPMR
jgi:hypothetical protein